MNLKLFHRLILLVLLATILLPGWGAFAQDTPPQPIPDDAVNAVAKQLYCPVCENIPLDVCPTQACAEWRELIRQKLAEGWEADEIKEYFALQYGDRVLSAPPARGFNWLVYIIPPLAILAGAFIVYRAFKAWNKPIAPSTEIATNQESNGDEYVQQMENLLKEQ